MKLHLETNGEKIGVINIKEIRKEKNITYKLENLYSNNLELMPIIVYKEHGLDGKHYTLIYNEKKFNEAEHDYKLGYSDGDIVVKVINRDGEHLDQFVNLLNKKSRREIIEENMKAVSILLDYWEELKSNNKKPKGKKRDWIAKKMNISSRTVQNYIRLLKRNKFNIDIDNDRNKINKDLTKLFMKYELKKTIKINKKSITIYFNNLEELCKILSIICQKLNFISKEYK